MNAHGTGTSLQQEYLWKASEIAGETSAFTLPFAFRIEGPLDVDRLQRAFNQLVRAKPILRTTYGVEGTRLIQTVTAISSVDAAPVVASPDGIDSLLRQEINRPFDLATGPLLRIRLFEVDDADHVLLLVVHSIVADHLSVQAMLDAVAASCRNSNLDAHRGSESQEDRRYFEFAAAQGGWLASPSCEPKLGQWRRHLENGNPYLNLPLDHARPRVRTRNGSHQKFELKGEKLSAIRAFCAAHAMPCDVFMLSAYAILLHKCSGQRDLSIGVAFANRSSPSHEGLFGPVSNLLPFVITVDEQLGFADFSSGLFRRVEGLADIQDVPYESILRSLALKVDTSYLPLFQVAFSYDSAPTFDLPETKVTTQIVLPRDVVQDIFLRHYDSPESLSCFAHFNCDLFSEASIQRLMSCFEMVIEQILAAPTAPIAEMSLFGSADRARMLAANADNRREEYLGCNLIDLFDRQALRSPDAIALVCGDCEVTYEELRIKSELLAGYLIRRGVQRGSSIGIYMDSSVEMVVAIYAILRAGCAYVPLDPEYPESRLSFIVADTSMAVILTNGRSNAAFGDQVVCVDLSTQWDAIRDANASASDVRITDADAAYILYTSGSTGKPKGVINTHGSVCNHMLWIQDTFKLSSADKMLQRTPYIFDGSLWEFFWPLQVGARLVIPPNASHRDLRQLIDAIEKYEISIVYIIPSLLNIFLDALAPSQCSSLRILISGGEMVTKELEQKVFSKLDVVLLNFYGPTEAAISVTCWQCDRRDKRHFVPIGYPIANTQIYLADKTLQLVPDGLYGEILIGGAAVAKGYLNRDDLTQQMFIDDPFSGQPNSRLYRTGDTGRRLPDGSLQILGRADDQVKIFGRRIELGEIEANITEHPGVSQAVVTTCSVAENDTRIVAYLVPDENTSFSVLRHLKLRDASGVRSALWEAPNRMLFSTGTSTDAAALFEATFGSGRSFIDQIDIPESGGIIVDIGADIGVFSVFAATTWPAKVFAFETDRERMAQLRTNLELYKGDFCVPTLAQAHMPGVASSSRGALLLQATEHIARMGVSRIDLLHVHADPHELPELLDQVLPTCRNVPQILITCRTRDSQADEVQQTLRALGFDRVTRCRFGAAAEMSMFFGSRLGTAAARAKPKAARSDACMQEWYSPSHLEESVRQFLSAKLSSNMIPSYFEVLAQLPLTPSGKISRLALPKPSFRVSDRNDAAPRSDAEAQCVSLWEKLLLRQVSVDDNFFDVGGNSFLAIQLVADISKALSRSIPIVRFFQYPTIRSFMRFLDGEAEKTGDKNEKLATRAYKQQQAFRREPVKMSRSS